MKSLEELAKIRDEARKMTGIRDGVEKTKVVVGMGTCGIAAGARDTMKAILDEISKRNLNDVMITQTGCIGLCEQEPIVEIQLPGEPKITYGKVNSDKARQIIFKHLVNGNIIGEWVIGRQ